MAKLKLVQTENQLMEIQDHPIEAPFVPATANPDFEISTIPSVIGANADRLRRGLIAFGAMVVWGGSIFFILLVPTIFLLPYLISHEPKIIEPEQLMEFAKTDPIAVFLQITAVIPAHLLTLGLAWLWVTRLGKFSFFDTLGWRSGGFRWWHYGVVLAGFFILAAVVGSYFPEQDNDTLRMLRSSRSAVYIVAFVATFTAPLAEEVIYRGVIYAAFERVAGITAAFLFTTFLFAVVHVPQYYPSYSTIFLLTVLSLTLTAIRVKTKNLLPCIILHTLFNGLQSVFLILEPLTKTSDLRDQATVILQYLK